jgi:hypothetical protein
MGQLVVFCLREITWDDSPRSGWIGWNWHLLCIYIILYNILIKPTNIQYVSICYIVLHHITRSHILSTHEYVCIINISMYIIYIMREYICYSVNPLQKNLWGFHHRLYWLVDRGSSIGLWVSTYIAERWFEKYPTRGCEKYPKSPLFSKIVSLWLWNANDIPWTLKKIGLASTKNHWTGTTAHFPPAFFCEK